MKRLNEEKQAAIEIILMLLGGVIVIGVIVLFASMFN